MKSGHNLPFFQRQVFSSGCNTKATRSKWRTFYSCSHLILDTGYRKSSTGVSSVHTYLLFLLLRSCSHPVLDTGSPRLELFLSIPTFYFFRSILAVIRYWIQEVLVWGYFCPYLPFISSAPFLQSSGIGYRKSSTGVISVHTYLLFLPRHSCSHSVLDTGSSRLELFAKIWTHSLHNHPQ